MVHSSYKMYSLSSLSCTRQPILSPKHAAALESPCSALIHLASFFQTSSHFFLVSIKLSMALQLEICKWYVNSHVQPKIKTDVAKIKVQLAGNGHDGIQGGLIITKICITYHSNIIRITLLRATMVQLYKSHLFVILRLSKHHERRTLHHAFSKFGPRHC